MNNSRLSTSSDKFTIDSKTKYALGELIKSAPLKIVNSEGRAMIIKELKYIRSTYIIQAVLPNGSISYFINYFNTNYNGLYLNNKNYNFYF